MKPLIQDSHYTSKIKPASVSSHACPRCAHGKAWDSALRSSDSLFRVLFYKPYRCRACMARFWKLHSSFRLNLVAASVVLLLTGLGAVYGNALLGASPLELSSSLFEEEKMKRRAQEGDASAAFQMGMHYMSSGVHKNYKEAAKWLEVAARKNNIEAQYYYGLSLLSGRGILQDYKAGFFWIEQAARKGHPDAQYSLGKMYRRGTGVEIDRARAYLWFNLAAAQGIRDAVKNRDSVANHLSLDKVIEMQEEAYRIGGDASSLSGLSENTLAIDSKNSILK